MCTLLRSAGLIATWIVGVTVISGCAQQDEQLSYSEAIEIYNAELETLQRLQAQRDALQQQLAPSGGELIEGLLGEATNMAGELRGELKTSLDELDDPAGNADQLADPGEAEKALGELSANVEIDAPTDESRSEIEAQIAALEEEIAAQKLRVARAKADRDAAEARRN